MNQWLGANMAKPLILSVCSAIWRLDLESRDTVGKFASLSSHFAYLNTKLYYLGVSEGEGVLSDLR